jgi:hypothetical protein
MGIPKSAFHEIITDLNFCKVCACWVSEMLTEQHESRQMTA